MEEQEDPAAIQDQQAVWRKRALKWLGRSPIGEDSADRPAKRHRTKAFEWMNAVDQQLKQCSSFDQGFKNLLLAPRLEDRGDADVWPYLRVASDTGSDMVSGLMFLAYNGFAVEGIWDPIHGAHADFSRCLKHTRNYAFALLLLVAWNLSYAPFDSGHRHHQILQSVESYLEKHSKTCPLLDHFLDDILAEAGMLDHRHEDDIHDQVVNMVRSHPFLQRRGRKAGMTRFLGLLFSAEDEVQVWSLRLLGWLYYGLQAHLFTKETFTALVKKKQALTATMQSEAEEAGSSMRIEDRAVANRLRNICSSGLQTAVLLYTDDISKVRVQIFLQFGSPLKEWMGMCSKNCRSVDTCAEWSQAQLSGHYFIHLLKMLRVMTDFEKLEAIGIKQNMPQGLPQNDQHPFVAEQDEFCELAGSFAMTLLRFRLQRFIYIARGWPYRACMFALPDQAGLVAPILEQLRTDKAHCCTLAGMTTRTARAMQKRSLFSLVTVQHVYEVCKPSGFRLPLSDRARAFFFRRSRVPVTSLLCEDALQRERLAEGGHRGGNRSVSRLHVWSTLVQRKVTSNVHKYAEVPVSAASESRMQLPGDQFQQKMSKCTPELKKVVSTSQTPPPWYSPSAANIHQAAVDLALLDFLDKMQNWGLMEQAWLSELGNGWPMIVKHRDEAQWHFALGCVGGTMVLGWPAVLRTFGEGAEALHIAMPNDRPSVVAGDASGLTFLCFAEVFKWRAMSFRFRSPSYLQCVASQRNIQLPGGLGIFAELQAGCGVMEHRAPVWLPGACNLLGDRVFREPTRSHQGCVRGLAKQHIVPVPLVLRHRPGQSGGISVDLFCVLAIARYVWRYASATGGFQPTLPCAGLFYFKGRYSIHHMCDILGPGSHGSQVVLQRSLRSWVAWVGVCRPPRCGGAVLH